MSLILGSLFVTAVSGCSLDDPFGECEGECDRNQGADTSSLTGWWTNETNLSGEEGESDVGTLVFAFQSDGRFYFAARNGELEKPSCLYSRLDYEVLQQEIRFFKGATSQDFVSYQFQGSTLLMDLWGRTELTRWHRISTNSGVDFEQLPVCDD